MGECNPHLRPEPGSGARQNPARGGLCIGTEGPNPLLFVFQRRGRWVCGVSGGAGAAPLKNKKKRGDEGAGAIHRAPLAGLRQSPPNRPVSRSENTQILSTNNRKRSPSVLRMPPNVQRPAHWTREMPWACPGKPVWGPQPRDEGCGQGPESIRSRASGRGAGAIPGVRRR